MGQCTSHSQPPAAIRKDEQASKTAELPATTSRPTLTVSTLASTASCRGDSSPSPSYNSSYSGGGFRSDSQSHSSGGYSRYGGYSGGGYSPGGYSDGGYSDGGCSGGGWSPCGGGCFAGDGLVAVGARGDATRRVDALRPGDAVFCPTLGRAVAVVATTRGLEHDKVCTVKGLRLTHKHPVKLDDKSGAWVFPKDVAATTRPAKPLVVHNFVLAEGAVMRVNGMSVITLGNQQSAGLLTEHPCAHPFYGTPKVLEHLKALPSWPSCEW